MTSTAPRTLRKDAERNRNALLAAASDLFAQRGFEVTLNDIAHHAGVGVGTAYRRFANKGEIVDALFDERLSEVQGYAADALAEEDAWTAFVDFIDRCLRMQLEGRGVTVLLQNRYLSSDRADIARDQIAPLVTKIVERAKKAGALRSDFEPTDAVHIQIALSAIMDISRTVQPELYQRYLAMFLDGVRTVRSSDPLPIEALSVSDSDLALRSITGS